jgi:hypothetical protein
MIQIIVLLSGDTQREQLDHGGIASRTMVTPVPPGAVIARQCIVHECAITGVRIASHSGLWATHAAPLDNST